MNNDFKRDQRILVLYNRSLRKKFTHGGTFSETELFNDALAMGVTTTTAQSYADAVIIKLKKGKYLR